MNTIAAIALVALAGGAADVSPPRGYVPAPREPEFDLDELRATAMKLHGIAQETKTATARRKALAALRIYRKASKDQIQRADEVHFFMAELQFDLGRFAAASDAFAASLNAEPLGVLAKDAAMNAILAAERAPKRKKNLHRVLTACAAFQAYVNQLLDEGMVPPDDETEASVLWSMAEAHRRLGDKRTQRRVLKTLAEKFPDDVYGQNAEQLLDPERRQTARP